MLIPVIMTVLIVGALILMTCARILYTRWKIYSLTQKTWKRIDEYHLLLVDDPQVYDYPEELSFLSDVLRDKVISDKGIYVGMLTKENLEEELYNMNIAYFAAEDLHNKMYGEDKEFLS